MKRCVLSCLAILLVTTLCFVGCKPAKGGNEMETTGTSETKEIRKVLMIGSSYSYYYCDELYELAKADGIDMRISNLYVSGGMMSQHYSQLTANNGIYDFITHHSEGKGRMEIKGATILDALTADQWDLITIQESYDPSYGITNPGDGQRTKNYVEKMLTYLKESYPEAKIMWQQVWSKEVGYQGPYIKENIENNFVNVPEVSKVLTTEKQTQNYEIIRDCALDICETFHLDRIPSGDAWQLARADERIGDTLCMKDKTHESEEGGGQYLNACVWYEVLTGNSCIGNTFRPHYALSEEKITILQEIKFRSKLFIESVCLVGIPEHVVIAPGQDLSSRKFSDVFKIDFAFNKILPPAVIAN